MQWQLKVILRGSSHAKKGTEVNNHGPSGTRKFPQMEQKACTGNCPKRVFERRINQLIKDLKRPVQDLTQVDIGAKGILSKNVPSEKVRRIYEDTHCGLEREEKEISHDTCTCFFK